METSNKSVHNSDNQTTSISTVKPNKQRHKPQVKLKWVNNPTKHTMLVVKGKHQMLKWWSIMNHITWMFNLKSKLKHERQTTRSKPRVKDGEKIQNRSWKLTWINFKHILKQSKRSHINIIYQKHFMINWSSRQF